MAICPESPGLTEGLQWPGSVLQHLGRVLFSIPILQMRTLGHRPGVPRVVRVHIVLPGEQLAACSVHRIRESWGLVAQIPCFCFCFFSKSHVLRDFFFPRAR